MLFCFKISAQILPHILGFSLCAEHHILAPSAEFKKNYLRKSFFALAPKMLLVNLTPN
jgi:hypothetical protein